MATDDLTRPLGIDASPRRRWPLPSARVGAGIAGGLLLAVALWIVVVDDPTGGEPVTVVAIRDGVPAAPRAELQPEPVPFRQEPGENGGEVVISEPGEPLVAELPEPDAGPAGVGDGVIIRDAATERAVGFSALPEPSLLEPGRDGPLPRVSEAGRRPFDAYARPAGEMVAGSTRIAIVVGGLGISDSGTASALDRLPPEVSLAFAPYGGDLPRWVGRAREQGHEVLLQVPLEPFDFPNNDPGPQTLLVDDPEGENADRLGWTLSRFTAYAGVVNYMGARFTSEPDAIRGFMQEVGERGLMYLDDGSSPRSVAGDVAGATPAPFASADLVLDTVPNSAAIDERLAQLEEIARERGSAIATASAYPASLERIAAWAERAPGRGIVLVPVTALAREPSTGQAAQQP